MTTIVATFPRSLRLFREGFHVWLKEKVWIKAQIQKHLGTPADRVLFVDHHLSHAASAFFASPFEEAAVLTVDGVGEWTTATCGRAAGDWGQGGPNRLDLTHELRFPHSLGLLYSVFTAFLGFEVNEGEYKVMGMAPFGRPHYVDQIRSIMELRDDGSLWLDPAYMRFHDTECAFTRRFEALFGRPRAFVMDHASWGKVYDEGAIAGALRAGGYRFSRLDDDERVLDQAVEALQRGDVVGWYHGRFEWGPRALGHRSIIADPRREDMKDIVNIKIKFREPFRPFAPSVLAEKAAQCFDLGDAAKHYPTRFMLYVAPVTTDRAPAITHADGSSRPQAVHREFNPRYHRLIEKFAEATGVPLVLNTSFNLKGDPIVSTPADALDTFARSGMDVLLLENFVVRKAR